jgi:hypothetical protein
MLLKLENVCLLMLKQGGTQHIKCLTLALSIGFFDICSGAEGVLLVLPLPRPTFLLLLGVTEGRVLGGILLPLSLSIREDGYDCLFTRGKVAGDI